MAGLARLSSQIIINGVLMAKRILITVGDILKEEYLDPMGISAYRLAHEIGVSTSLMSQIIHGSTAISAIEPLVRRTFLENSLLFS